MFIMRRPVHGRRRVANLRLERGSHTMRLRSFSLRVAGDGRTGVVFVLFGLALWLLVLLLLLLVLLVVVVRLKRRTIGGKRGWRVRARMGMFVRPSLRISPRVLARTRSGTRKQRLKHVDSFRFLLERFDRFENVFGQDPSFDRVHARRDQFQFVC